MIFTEKFALHMVTSDLLFPILLVWMLLMAEIGWRFGHHLSIKYQAQKADSSDTFLAAIFGLMALLVALTFSGGSDRFDHRRELIIQEVSTISTGYLSVDLLSSKDQPKIRELFNQYLDSRINIYQFEGAPSAAEIESRTQIHNAVGDRLWKEVVHAVGNTQYPQKLVAAQILPQLSDMFTASENQRLSVKLHPPLIVFQLMLILCMIGSMVAGYNLGLQSQRDWFLTLVFVVLMTGTIFIILSLKYPRMGKISLGNFESEFISLKKSF
jgi:hypothetical protein